MDIVSYQIIHATLRSATPIILAVLAAIVSKQANVFNLAIEGIMLYCALFAIIVSASTKSWVLALLATALVGMTISFVIGILHLKFHASILVVGFALNASALGGTRLIMQKLFGTVGSYAPNTMVALPRLQLGILKQSTVLESLLNGYSLFEILAIPLILALAFFLYRTKLGLRLRSVGLNETAAATAGINVYKTKLVAIIISGLFASMAGAHLSMGYTNMFVEGMTNGRGFMANAAVNFGAGDPVASLFGALLFGFSESLGLRLQSTGTPAQFVLMLPYIVTVIILTISMIRQAKVKSNQQRREYMSVSSQFKRLKASREENKSE